VPGVPPSGAQEGGMIGDAVRIDEMRLRYVNGDELVFRLADVSEINIGYFKNADGTIDLRLPTVQVKATLELMVDSIRKETAT
jgi:hypothetical protein